MAKSVLIEQLQKAISTRESLSYSDMSASRPQFLLNEILDNCLFKDIDHFGYFENHDSSLEVMALGASHFPLDANQSYPQDNIIGFQTFAPLVEHEGEWRDWKGQSFYKPQIMITRKQDDITLSVLTTKLEDFNFSLDRYPLTKNMLKRSQSSEKEEKQRYKKAFKLAYDKLEREEIEKIVLSRRAYLESVEPIDWRRILNDHFLGDHKTYRFVLKNKDQCFYSLTPECLFRKNQSKYYIDSIAGTTLRKTDHQNEEELFEELINDEKELREHDIVTREIKNSLEQLNIRPSLEFQHRPLRLKHIQHIHSQLSFSSTNHSLSDLIGALHPTPAVGGHPKAKTYQLIPELEGFDRGAYAAPCLMSLLEQSYVLVGLRCAHLTHHNRLTLYAGSGIVRGSLVDKEWQETENKLKNFTSHYL